MNSNKILSIRLQPDESRIHMEWQSIDIPIFQLLPTLLHLLLSTFFLFTNTNNASGEQ